MGDISTLAGLEMTRPLRFTIAPYSPMPCEHQNTWMSPLGATAKVGPPKSGLASDNDVCQIGRPFIS
jgi:hypothetical protein